MRPRVKCSKCNFTGKEGKEMRGHMENEHQTEFKCKEWYFIKKNRVLVRRHIKSTPDKNNSESCHFDAENESALNDVSYTLPEKRLRHCTIG